MFHINEVKPLQLTRSKEEVSGFLFIFLPHIKISITYFPFRFFYPAPHFTYLIFLREQNINLVFIIYLAERTHSLWIIS